MNINWITIAILLLLVIILVGFLVWRNRKDKEKVEKYFNENDGTLSENKEEDELNDNL